MRDYLGNKLAVGGEVIFVEGRYNDLDTGKILKIGKVKLTIDGRGNRLSGDKSYREGRRVVKVQQKVVSEPFTVLQDPLKFYSEVYTPKADPYDCSDAYIEQ